MHSFYTVLFLPSFCSRVAVEYCCLNPVCINTTGFTGIVSRIVYECAWPSPGSSTEQCLLISNSIIYNDGQYAISPADAATVGDAAPADREDGA